MYKDNSQLIDMVLRILKNLLITGIVKPHDFLDQSLIESLLPLMVNKCRISIIARILSILCTYSYFKQQVSENKDILSTILNILIHN